MDKFEYQCKTVDVDKCDDEINALGKERWEAFGVYPLPTTAGLVANPYAVIWFKRRIYG